MGDTFSGTQKQLTHRLLWLRLQLLVYAVPAQQPGFAHVQLPLPLPAPQLPWMTREPGVGAPGNART